MLIRLRCGQDLPACVAALRQVHQRDAYPTAWPADPAAWLSPPGHLAAWVAQVDGEVAGHVCLVAGAHHLDAAAAAAATGADPARLATLSRLFTAASARGRGVGATLLGTVSEHAADAGLQLVLDVVDDGGAGARLYERCGWHLLHQRLADWATPSGEHLPVRVYTAPPRRAPTEHGGASMGHRGGMDVADERGDTVPDQVKGEPQGNPDVRVREMEVVFSGWHVLRRATVELRRRDGTSATLTRDVYDTGEAATVLLHDTDRAVVLLTRQFRLPAYVGGHGDGMLVESAGGALDGQDPTVAIAREASEELGVDVGQLTPVFTAYMSPGSTTQRIHFYAAPYTAATRTSTGGGLAAEGEDIEAVEIAFTQALAMVREGRIIDAKTIMLIQWAALEGPFAHGLPAGAASTSCEHDTMDVPEPGRSERHGADPQALR